jgi:hypothetical protein
MEDINQYCSEVTTALLKLLDEGRSYSGRKIDRADPATRETIDQRLESTQILDTLKPQAHRLRTHPFHRETKSRMGVLM